MFLGDYQHTLDAKGRVSLPAKFRHDVEGKRLVVAQGFEGCLYVYPAEDYARFVDRLMSIDDFNPAYRRVRRFFTTGAQDIPVDGAGRIGIPQNLREYAGLDRDVAITGNGDRIEIWDAEKWAAYTVGGADESIEDIAKELADAGLL